MAKGSNNVKPKRSHLYKPYDSANSSLFSRLTTRVSEILPQPTSWLSRWATPAEQQTFQAESDGDDEEIARQQPPSKKMCMRPPSNDLSSQQNHVLQTRNDPELSPILRNRYDQPDGVVAGPSGLNLRGSNFIASTPAVQVPTEAPVKLNGDEGSDGSESTSGCSSLVPQGERTMTAPFPQTTPKPSPETPKLSITPNSLGGRRLSIKPKNRTMDMSSSFIKSRPSFDAYAFNNPLNKSSSLNLSFNRTLDDSTASPFYRGRTMYGGNSSCKESLSLSLSSPKVGTPRHVSVRPSPTPVQNRDTISTSALKILRAIEQFSTPVLDTKKIPLKSESERRKRKAPQPFEDLVIPTMPDLLRIKRKQRTVSESLAEPSTPSISTPKPYQLPPPVQPLSVRDDAPEPKRVMKGKNAEVMKAELVEKVNLPSIPLPIKSLPSFSHLSSLPTSSTYTTPATASTAMFSCKSVSTTSPSQSSPLSSFRMNKTGESAYKFSRPTVESDSGVSIPSIKPKLQFREPLRADASAISAPSKSKEPAGKAPQDAFVPVLKLTNNSTNFFSSSSTFQPKLKKVAESKKPAPEKKTGNVADFFSKDKNKSKESDKDSSKSLVDLFKPVAGSWSCATCMVTNPADKSKCNCCETPKPAQKDVSINSLPSEKTWSCSKCSFKNKESADKCVCGLKKGEKSTVEPLNTLKEFAKAPSDTWECKECFVRNKNSDSSCVACSAAKPGTSVAKPAPSLSSLFKKPEGSWECSSCMVSNKSAESACVACGTSKPGAAPASKATPAFSFGIPSVAAATAASPASSATTSTTSIISATANTFSFGNALNKTGGDNDKQPSAGFGSFKFGIPPSTSAKTPIEESKEKTSVVPTTAFTFGSAATAQATKMPVSSPIVVNDDDDKDIPPKKRVSFGAPLEKIAKPVENAASAENSNKISAPSFTFGATKTEPSTTFQFAGASTTSAFGSSRGAASSSTDAKTCSENAFKFGSSSTGVSSSTDSTTTACAAPTPTATTVASGFGMFSNASTNASKPLFPAAEKKPEPSFSGNNPSFLSSSSEPKAFSFGSINKAEVADTSKLDGPGSNLFSKKESSNTLFGMPPPAEAKASGFFNSNDASKQPFFKSEPNENKNIFGGAKPIPTFSGNTNSVFELKPATTVSNSTGGFNTAPGALPTAFGSQTAMLNNTEQKPLAFGAMQSTPSSNSAFMFKTTDPSPKPSGGFSFAAPNPIQNAAPQQNAFGFNSETPTFGVPAANPLPAAPAAIFGATSATPIFNNMTPAPPFAFGASQPSEPPAPAAPFGFSAAQPQASTTPFPFNVQNTMATPTPVQPPTFDPNLKPSFNFTGGATPNFAAPPSTSAETKLPDRKIRRAVRRTQR